MKKCVYLINKDVAFTIKVLLMEWNLIKSILSVLPAAVALSTWEKSEAVGGMGEAEDI